MMRISPHLIAMRRKASPPAGNRSFTMSSEWGGKAYVQEGKSRRPPHRGRRLSVRLSGL
jgi:hypothetical protein